MPGLTWFCPQQCQAHIPSVIPLLAPLRRSLYARKALYSSYLALQIITSFPCHSHFASRKLDYLLFPHTHLHTVSCAVFEFGGPKVCPKVDVQGQHSCGLPATTQ